MKDHLETVIAIISIIGFIGSALLYYRGSVEKDYAAKRDFNHLKNSLAQLGESIDDSLSDLHNGRAQMMGELKEIKAMTMTFSQRLDSILTRVEMHSGLFGRRNHEP